MELNGAEGLRSVDPPPSSWPSSLRNLLDAVIAFMFGRSAEAGGTARAPLCHMWELYENWIAMRAQDVLTNLLGAPTTPPKVLYRNSQGGQVWTAEWSFDGRSVAMWSQPEFRAKEKAGQPAVVSCTSALIPDFVVRLEGGGSEFHVVLDAKYRGADALSQGDVGAEGSKYLWGLRPAAEPDASAVDQVVLVSTGRPASAIDPSRARVSGVTVTYGDSSELEELLIELIG